MSNIVTILSESFSFAILVSLFTQGIGAAANNGGILYPIKDWLESITISSLKERYKNILLYRDKRRMKYQASEWINSALSLLEYKMYLKSLWAKPILLCTICMPSFWGTILFWILPICHTKLYIWLLGIPIASILSVYAQKLKP